MVIFFPLIDPLHLHRPGPALDGDPFRGQVAGRLIGQQHTHLGGKITKILGGNIFFPQKPKFMTNQGVFYLMDSHVVLLFSGYTKARSCPD